MCTSNLATFKLKMWKSMGENPVGINSLPIGGSYVPLSPITQHHEKNLINHGDLVATIHKQH